MADERQRHEGGDGLGWITNPARVRLRTQGFGFNFTGWLVGMIHNSIERIAMFDTSVGTDNVGDFIIMESVNRYLAEVFPLSFTVRVPTHDYLGEISRKNCADADYVFVGGTNILSSHFWYYRQWKLRLSDAGKVGKPILMGVGWHKYQRDTDPVSVMFYRKLLNRDAGHSVRDLYTQEKLAKAGFDNVIYTGCPTMWGLTEEVTARIPTRKSEDAIFTLTFYLRDVAGDRAFFKMLKQQYRRVRFFPQSYDDVAYAREVCGEDIECISPDLGAYRTMLAAGNVDYIGTRLHGGVFALQHGVRALIIEVDNRAAEIARSTGLPTMKRNDLDALRNWIAQSPEVRLTLPFDNIARWKAQFKGGEIQPQK